MGGLFTLADHSCTDLVWPFSAGGHTGHCTDNGGTLSYAKIQRAVDTGAKVKFMKDADIKRFPRARPEDIVQRRRHSEDEVLLRQLKLPRRCHALGYQPR